MSTRLRHLTPLVALSCGALTLCFLTSVSRLALAQTVGPVPPPAFGAIESNVLNALVQAFVPIAISGAVGLIALLPSGFSWLSAHTKIAKSAWADGVKNRFLNLIEQFVLVELQTSVGAIKADFAAGKLTPGQYKASLANVKARVIANALAAASSQNLLADLQQVLGLPGNASVQPFAADAVEASLARLQRVRT